jgi:hypothetical protein
MKLSIITAFFLVIFVDFLHKASAGPGYPACILACELACTGTLIVPVSLPVYLACAAQCPVYCLASCFHENTSITVQRKTSALNQTTETISIAMVKAGDLIQTLNEHTHLPEWTKVMSNTFHETPSSFVALQTDDGSMLSVTEAHVMKVYRDGVIYALPANKVTVSDQIMDHQRQLHQVISVSQSTGSGKYDLITDYGSVLANGLLVSTICEDALTSEHPLWNYTLSAWKAVHKF